MSVIHFQPKVQIIFHKHRHFHIGVLSTTHHLLYVNDSDNKHSTGVIHHNTLALGRVGSLADNPPLLAVKFILIR